jgi:myo-inositol-1(or 4)-monophosphatase
VTALGAATDSSYADLLALADAAAREAGRLLVEQRPAEVTVAATKSSPTDVVTAMDQASERLLRERLLGARPGDGMLGEEGGGTPGTSGVRWVVDPIDGTVNYLYGLAHWAVSVAAEVDGVVVAGVVHAPVLGHTWSATLDGPARCDDEPVHASTRTVLAKALVATGFGYAATRRARQAQVLLDVLPVVRDIRRAGAASLDLCAVASGQVDAYYEQGLKPWDLAAGGLVAARAGARVGGLHGGPAGERLVVAAPPALFAQLTAVLESVDADR